MSRRILQVVESNEPDKADSPEGPPFPSARYFQIRFEYLHEVLTEMKQQLEEANLQIRALHARLEILDGKADAAGSE